MSKINWGGGLKRIFIASSVLYWLIAIASVIFGVSSTWEVSQKVPDKTWFLYDVKSPDGNLYTVYSDNQTDAINDASGYLDAIKNTPSEPWKADPVILPDTSKTPTPGTTFDPTTAKPLKTVICQGDSYGFPPDTTTDTIKSALTRHFKEEADKKNAANLKAMFVERLWMLLWLVVGYGIFCAVVFTIRWIVKGFKVEKAG